MSRSSVTPRSVNRMRRAKSKCRRMYLETLESRCLMSATPADPVAGVSIAATDEQGNPIDHVEVGDTFLLNVSVQDVRDRPEGVFSMYFDLLYDKSLMEVAGEIKHSDLYPSLPMGDTSRGGIVNDSGGFSNSIRPLGAGVLPLYSIPMRAIASGSAVIAGDPADCYPVTAVGVYGDDNTVPEELVDYGGTTLTIGSGGKAPMTREELAQLGSDGCSKVTQIAPPIEYDFTDDIIWIEENFSAEAAAQYETEVLRLQRSLQGNAALDEGLRVVWLPLSETAAVAATVTEQSDVPLLETSSSEALGQPSAKPQPNTDPSSNDQDNSTAEDTTDLLDEVFAQLGA